jgi:nitronate monooxygenase
MAGGPSTPALVIAAAEAGALGMLAAGYKTPEAMASEMDAVRSATDGAFGVNVFVPGRPTEDPDGVAAYVQRLKLLAEQLDVTLGEPVWDDDFYDAKVDQLTAKPPDVVTFTFGCPGAEVIETLQSKGALVGITVTTPDEARTAAAHAPDFLCLQGSEAGAHRGAFVNGDHSGQDVPLRQLLAAAQAITDLPLIAAGGLATTTDIGDVLERGATQAQLGTALLRCTESGAHSLYKAALTDPQFTETAVTRAFSGRRARSLVNDMVRHYVEVPKAYPEINNATRPFRAAAASHGDPQHISLYAGEGYRMAEDGTAGEIIERLTAGLPS